MFSLLIPAMLAAPAQMPAPAPTTRTSAAMTEQLLRDTRGRPVIRTWIDDRGPIEMIVDTAAQTSLIVANTATRLGLKPEEKAINVVGATGNADAVVYQVSHFSSGLFSLSDVPLVSLPNAATTDAQGIVGMDAFEGRRILFDRVNARLVSEPSGPPAPGFVAVKGRRDEDGFVRIPMTLDGVTIDAVVDTGAAVTMVNAAVLRRLGWAVDDPRLKAGGEIRGAAESAKAAKIASFNRVVLGPVTLSNAPLVVSGDTADEQPAILLGNDILNLLDAYTIDFIRAELLVRIPPVK